MSLSYSEYDMSESYSPSAYLYKYPVRHVNVGIFNRLDPVSFKFDRGRDEIKELTHEHFMNEVATLRAAEGSGHTPRCVSYDVQQQSPDMPYPGGYMFIVVMSRVPGWSFDELLDHREVTQDDASLILPQIIYTME